MNLSLSMVKCLILLTRFCRDEISFWDKLMPVKKQTKFHSRMKKRKKRHVGMKFYNEHVFLCMYSDILSKFNMFECNESMDI